jgi:YVTN family beta-propeller protein
MRRNDRKDHIDSLMCGFVAMLWTSLDWWGLCAALLLGTTLITGPAEAAPFAYVPNHGSANVSVIDMATNTAVGTPIPVGTGPVGVAFTPDGRRAYAANQASSRALSFPIILGVGF